MVLPLLESDLLDIFEAVSDQRLSEVPVVLNTRKTTASVVAASGG